MSQIALSRLHFPVTTLGPGRRVGIWLQGCSIRCPGCISMDTWADDRGVTTVEAVLETIAQWIPIADGFTVSGGEPFDQPNALLLLLEGIRRQSNADILVFTGYPLEAIAQHLEHAKGLIDALITDPFDRNLPQTLALRGSDNQRLRFLTTLGRRRFSSYNRVTGREDRALDLMLDEHGTVWMAGIPERHQFRQLRQILEAQGHRLSISEDERHQITRRLAAPK